VFFKSAAALSTWNFTTKQRMLSPLHSALAICMHVTFWRMRFTNLM
jgi:hypothetical protein